MGILGKIEDKLTGSNKHESEQQHQQTGRSSLDNQTQDTKHNPLQHPVQSAQGKTGHGVGGSVPGAFPTGANTSHTSGAAGYGNDSGNLQTTTERLQNTSLGGSHPSSNLHSTSGQGGAQQGLTSSTGQYGTQHGQNLSASQYGTQQGQTPSSAQYGTQQGQTSSTSQYGTGNPSTSQYGTQQGQTSSTSHNTPRQPYDPYSSKGQQIAAAAGVKDSHHHSPTQLSQGRTDAQDYGSRSSVDSDVARTRHGGVSNGLDESTLHSGPHSSLENRDAVPTAGGQKVGNIGQAYGEPQSSSYDGTTSGQHSYGRDAAIAGGVGAAGIASQHHAHGHDHQHAGSRRTDASTYSSGTDPVSSYDQTSTSRQHHDQPGTNTQSRNTSGGLSQSQTQSSVTSRHPEQEISYMKNKHDTSSDEKKHHHLFGHHKTEAGTTSHGGSDRNVDSGKYSSGQDKHGLSSGITGSSHTHSSSTADSSGHHSLAKKLGAAYEAGYRDALEHMKAERGY